MRALVAAHREEEIFSTVLFVVKQTQSQIILIIL